ncbi:MAG: hypothetical protein ACRDCT_07335, partial [Shewanella sp.]
AKVFLQNVSIGFEMRIKQWLNLSAKHEKTMQINALRLSFLCCIKEPFLFIIQIKSIGCYVFSLLWGVIPMSNCTY